MNDKAFHFLMLQLGQLTPSQRHQLHSYFQQADTGAADTLLVEHSPTCCPHCQASRLRPQSAALPLRPCNPLTGTPLARLRKRKHWLYYAQALIDGKTVRRAATECHIKRTRPSCGATASWLWLRDIRLYASPASWKRMRPSFWSPSKASEKSLARPVSGRSQPNSRNGARPNSSAGGA